MPEPTGTRPITTWARGLLPPLFLAAMIIVGACDFQLLEPPQLPRWGFSLTIPLINMTYNLSELAESDTTISQDTTTNELQIEFSGALDTTSIDSSFLEVELPAEATLIDINQSVNAPAASDVFTAVAETVQVTIRLADLLEDVGFSVSLPAGFPVTIPQLYWNSMADSPVDQEEGPYQIIDTTALVDDFEFIKRLRYVELSSTPLANRFYTNVTSDEFPVTIDTVSLTLDANPLFVVHETTALALNTNDAQTSDLASEQLGSTMSIGIHIVVPTVGAGGATIAAETDPGITLEMILAVDGVDSLAITTAQTSLIKDPPDPLALPSEIQITEGVLRSDVTAPVNQISLFNLGTDLPLDIRFQLTFPNFASTSAKTDSLTSGPPDTLRKGQPLINRDISIAGYTFHNPAGDGPVSEFEYELLVEVLEKDLVLPLDGSSLGSFLAGFEFGDANGNGKGDLHFQSIIGNFSLSFDAVNTTIQDIPTGFAGFQFGRLSLSLLLRNQIDLPVQLDLRLIGRTFEGDSMAVPINPLINYPSAPEGVGYNSDTAITLIVLDESSVSTYWLGQGGTAFKDTTVYPVGNTIVDVLNLPPDIIEVAGAAVVEGEGVVEAGKGIWGEFELIAPFAFILPQDISFLPVAPIPLAPMDEDTREQIQTALLSASLSSTVQTKFPIGGKISMLASNDTLFTLALDYLDDIAAGFSRKARTGDTTFYSDLDTVLAADGITGIEYIVFYPDREASSSITDPLQTVARRVEFYTQGDTAPAFWIGHLFDIELPPPSAFTEEGWVDTGGYAKQEIILDAERVGWIASDTTVYLKTFITLYNTSGIDSVRTIQSTNSIHFSAFITFNLASDILGEEEEPDSSEIEVTPISDMTLVLASTDTVYLDSVFVPPAGKEIKDLDLAATTSHAGIAKGTIKTLRTGGIRKYLLVTPVSPGTARITVSADDDPEDDIDPATASFLVTVQEANGESTPPVPSIHKVARHNRLW